MRRASVLECAGPPALLASAPKAAEGCRTPRPGGILRPSSRTSMRPVNKRFMGSEHLPNADVSWDHEPGSAGILAGEIDVETKTRRQGCRRSQARFIGSLHGFMPRIGTMNPPPAPPKRGASRRGLVASSPPGRGAGVGGFMGSFDFPFPVRSPKVAPGSVDLNHTKP